MKKMMIAAVAALMLQSCGMTNPGVNGGSQTGGTTTNNSGSSIGSNALGGLLGYDPLSDIGENFTHSPVVEEIWP